MVSACAWATGAAQTLVHISGTAGTSETRKAGARKGAQAILTGATIQAGVGVTVIDVLVTGRPTIPPVAGTAETPLQVGAGTMGATGGGPSTLVHILLASWALPARGAGADRQLARDRLAVAPVLTGVWGTGGQQFTLMTLYTRGTGTVEAHSITGAGATRPAGLGFTGISSQALAASGTTPARLTHTAEPSGRIVADTMTARILGTGMARRKAEWGQGARRAEAAEAIFPIHTGASVTTRTGRTLVDLHVAKGPCKARLADTVIAVDAIAADSKGAGVAGTIINVHLTVHSCGARRAAAEVFVHQV